MLGQKAEEYGKQVGCFGESERGEIKGRLHLNIKVFLSFVFAFFLGVLKFVPELRTRRFVGSGGIWVLGFLVKVVN